MERDTVWAHVHHERAALADLLETLSPAEWEHPSLCPGWTVRHVAAHVISSPQIGVRQLLVALWRGRGDYDRSLFLDAIRRAERPVEQIVADYRRFDGSRRHPPGTTALDPLLDVLVHTQDITVPLALRRAMPPEAAATAARRVWDRSFPFAARRRFAGLSLVAEDAPFAVGDGPEVRGTAEDLLLLLTGRTVALDRVRGPGLARLAAP